MAAGENTLNTVCARLLLRTLLEQNGDAARAGGAEAKTSSKKLYDPQAWLSTYIDFMRTPGSHNDTYAETYHRMFFRNLVERGLPAEKVRDFDDAVWPMSVAALLLAAKHGGCFSD